MQFGRSFVHNESNLVVTHHKKPDGFDPLSKETIDNIADWVTRYPDIHPEEKDQPMEILSPLAETKAQMDQGVGRPVQTRICIRAKKLGYADWGQIVGGPTAEAEQGRKVAAC
ncbi:MAG: hypothetical protein L6R38_008865 [Xanthoria sp. 2 TBL-2021]|nr:MAG: hypothetical protein L6R38_008865 [Xanthoria sp. 2 TBL-2021]